MKHAVTGPVRHHFIPAAGVLLHALEFGKDTSDMPPLVLLHGVTGHAWLWHDVAARLAANRRVIAYDLRGHGDSQWSAEARYDSEDHIADLQALSNSLSLERFSIAGLSWGALIGIGFAARHPERVDRMAIVDVEASFSVDQDAVAPRPETFASIEEAMAWERKANPHAPSDLLELFARQSVRPAQAGGWVRKHDPFFFRRWPFRRDDRWSELRSLRMPLVLVNGGRSFVRTEVMQDMAASVPGAQFEIVADSGHLIPLEAPDVLAQQLVRFFDAPLSGSK
ncbi:alpha/beta hydrolase [Variovorax dokdonensis]|uniref:Alpha/beta hydrolase n=1 Tax=Variovorax dokdonensis TaxID=344883 RepID=A0ABT7NE09_9BURK|nr:alpha/beta hydrolase [Variovorax dokdonensis]MDM0046181.1 alpha/beta hydrolase [Variovorax dokdonensis]